MFSAVVNCEYGFQTAGFDASSLCRSTLHVCKSCTHQLGHEHFLSQICISSPRSVSPKLATKVVLHMQACMTHMLLESTVRGVMVSVKF